MKNKIALLIMILLVANISYAYVIKGTYTQPVLDGDIATADEKARENSMLNALKNYFDTLKVSAPDKVIPDVTTEFFKFIKSYKIAERKYANDTVVYTILADVDDVALNDLTYFVKNAVNTVIYTLSGLPASPEREELLAAAFKDYKFDLRNQSDFQANLPELSNNQDRMNAFLNSESQYFLDITIEDMPAPEGECSIFVTTKTFSKTREFQTLKTQSAGEDADKDICINTAFSNSFLKTIAYVRENFIPLPVVEKVLSTFIVTAVNYDNFATPKKIMGELQKRAFIESYKIISFAGNKLNVEVSTYIDIDVLMKKLQSVENEYGFASAKESDSNILLDFTK